MHKHVDFTCLKNYFLLKGEKKQLGRILKSLLHGLNYKAKKLLRLQFLAPAY